MPELITPLAQRFSARAYEGRSIPPAALASLMEAARSAPSSYNDQPWVFIVAPRQDRQDFAALLGCLGGNQDWARGAAVLMACCAAKAYAHNGKPHRHAWHDVGLAVMALTLQAVSLGLQAREMAGIDRELARQRLGVPESHDIVTGLAVGVPAETLEQKGGRHRKPLGDIAFQGAWGRRPDFLKGE